MWNRRQCRTLAFELLFGATYQPDLTPTELLTMAEQERECPPEASEYLSKVLCGIEADRAEADAIIDRYAIGWKRERMSRASLTLLRLALYEMRHLPDVPYHVAINEAIELAKQYDHEKAPAFLNGILNAAAEGLGLKQTQKKPTDK